jgi:hypothetical protein
MRSKPAISGRELSDDGGLPTAKEVWDFGHAYLQRHRVAGSKKPSYIKRRQTAFKLRRFGSGVILHIELSPRAPWFSDPVAELVLPSFS